LDVLGDLSSYERGHATLGNIRPRPGGYLGNTTFSVDCHLNM
jgi:hypothetical protein